MSDIEYLEPCDDHCDHVASPPETRTERVAVQVRELPVQLTDDEVRELGRRLAHIQGQLSAHEKRESDVKADLKAKRASLESQASVVGGLIRAGEECLIRAGEEYRPVDVVVEHVLDEGLIREVRSDTGEVIAERPLREDERQRSLLPTGKSPSSSPSPSLPPTADEKKAAEHAATEEQADALLGDSGDGAMNAKALKGDAVVHRRAP